MKRQASATNYHILLGSLIFMKQKYINNTDCYRPEIPAEGSLVVDAWRGILKVHSIDAVNERLQDLSRISLELIAQNFQPTSIHLTSHTARWANQGLAYIIHNTSNQPAFTLHQRNCFQSTQTCIRQAALAKKYSCCQLRQFYQSIIHQYI